MHANDEILDRVANLARWKRRGEFAPHKPLLMLYALGELSRGRTSVSFVDVDHTLSQLLREFGPRRKSVHPEYPFWRLQNDGLWEVSAKAPLASRSSNKDAKKSELITKDAIGAFPEHIRQSLQNDPAFLRSVASTVLASAFPETLHDDILAAVSLSLDATSGKRKRDPGFRQRVLRAYERRCCVCGYDLRLGDRLAGIEAAHIMWIQVGGPDTETNGLSLCTLHHKLFDLGAFTIIADGLRVVFSQDLAGSIGDDRLLSVHGQALHRPQSDRYLPDPEYLKWHERTLFRDPGRDLPDALD